MTNPIAIVLGLILVAAYAYDASQGGDGFLFLMQKQDELIEWLAFWR
ncbi:glyceraldehyde-3-phosphate dehydrogenase [Palleronia caenipelagi]|uniref:Glyceraldehyde-3-phosphate dehydrogenase n=1 Tax=Palleronia caenipelagi TaxID=2489174 RepID=A0A547Q319_9RHOB|nr:glyceraldehyde-3-phosphate dehydrogenase [Palleronia caenipelagi]TRD20777.1 glyceraldehyde-3-phosphate dehydrogenase [Palleronia caenipelagi]